MKSLSCKDMGMETCDFVASGATEEEVMQAMTAHAQASHPEAMEKMKGMSPENVAGMMKSKMKDA